MLLKSISLAYVIMLLHLIYVVTIRRSDSHDRHDKAFYMVTILACIFRVFLCGH